jgi:hypothetical protein
MFLCVFFVFILKKCKDKISLYILKNVFGLGFFLMLLTQEKTKDRKYI